MQGRREVPQPEPGVFKIPAGPAAGERSGRLEQPGHRPLPLSAADQPAVVRRLVCRRRRWRWRRCRGADSRAWVSNCVSTLRRFSRRRRRRRNDDHLGHSATVAATAPACQGSERSVKSEGGGGGKESTTGKGSQGKRAKGKDSEETLATPWPRRLPTGRCCSSQRTALLAASLFAIRNCRPAPNEIRLGHPGNSQSAFRPARTPHP